MKDYREYIQNCFFQGERVQYVYAKHCRQAILEQLYKISEGKQAEDPEEKAAAEENAVTEDSEEKAAAKENTATEDPEEKDVAEEIPDEQLMLWALKENEVIEKGIYRYNKPDSELLVCASPALMALILGEYKLAKKICEMDPKSASEAMKKGTALEILQDEKGLRLEGSEIRFCEACILCSDMEPEETVYFMEKGMFDLERYIDPENSFFSKVDLNEDQKQRGKYIVKMMERLKHQENVCEIFKGFKLLLVCYAMIKKIDIGNADFWKDVYELYDKDEEWNELTVFAHRILLKKLDVKKDILEKQYRLLTCIEEHFRHTDYLRVDSEVEDYIKYLLLYAETTENHAEFKNYLVIYFQTVQRFGGEETLEWKRLMLELLKKGDLTMLELGFQKQFLKEEWIAEYIEHLIHQKEGAWVLTYLIYKNWLVKEKKNGNVQR